MDGWWLDALTGVLQARAKAMDPDALDEEDEAVLDYDAMHPQEVNDG